MLISQACPCYRDFGVALAKYMAQSAASIVAHCGEAWVVICFRKWMSYSSHGDPWKSWLACFNNRGAVG